MIKRLTHLTAFGAGYVLGAPDDLSAVPQAIGVSSASGCRTIRSTGPASTPTRVHSPSTNVRSTRPSTPK